MEPVKALFGAGASTYAVGAVLSSVTVADAEARLAAPVRYRGGDLVPARLRWSLVSQLAVQGAAEAVAIGFPSSVYCTVVGSSALVTAAWSCAVPRTNVHDGGAVSEIVG